MFNIDLLPVGKPIDPMARRVGVADVGFGRLCSKQKLIMLLAVLIFFRNCAKIMLLSENYALCPRNYAT